MRETPEETTMPVAVHESWLPAEHPLHRPRHGRRQRTALICAVIFFMLPAFTFVLGVRPEAIENHKLAGFPSIADGFGFFTGLSGWATDNLPLRAEGVRSEDAISQGLFGELPQKGSNGNGSGPVNGGPAGETGAQTPGTAARSQYPNVVAGKDGWLYYGYDMGMKCVTVRPLNDVANSIRDFQHIVLASGRKLVILIPPDKSTILPQFMPDQYAGKQCMESYRSKFWPKITSTANILDLRSQLNDLAKTDPDPIYFKTDTHWEDQSAIMALGNIAVRIQPGITKSWQVDEVTTTEREGDLARMSGNTETEPWVRYRISPDGKVNNVPKDLPDLNQPITVNNVPAKGMITDPTVILGDSFSLPIDRYASNTFSNVTFGSYEELQGGVPAVQKLIVNSKVVVLEMLERGVATGESQLLMPQSLAALKTQLQQHPIR